MKKGLLTLVVLLAAFSAFSQNYQYINSNTSFNTGIYYINGWGNVTLTVPEGQDVTFVFNGSAYGSGKLVVEGSLKANTRLQTAGSIIVGSNGRMTIDGELVPGGGSNFASGSIVSIQKLSLDHTLTVGGKLTIDGDASVNSGGLTLGSTGTISTNNIAFNGNNSISGSLTVGNSVTIHNATSTMSCPGSITTTNLYNYNINTISGSGFITVTGTFTSGNPLTNSPTITLNSPDAGNGTNAQKQPGQAILSSINPCAPTSPNTLPVVFGPVNARISNSVLTINWTTLSETNNDHFEIEVSADGQEFHKTGERILSKALNGNSDNTITYSFSQNINASAFAAVTFTLLLLIPGFSKRKKITAWITGAVLVFAGTLHSCSKQDAVNLPEQANVFVRIVQVDKDGTTKYSPVIKTVE